MFFVLTTCLYRDPSKALLALKRLTYSMLAYDMLKRPPKCAPAGTASAHFNEPFLKCDDKIMV